MIKYYSFLKASAGSFDTDLIAGYIVAIIDRDNDGTAIGMAIANAINRLRFSETKSKIIILLSDGSNNSGEIDPITAAELAEKFNIKIYTIAAGTNGLAPYPVEDIWGRTIIRNIEVEVDDNVELSIGIKEAIKTLSKNNNSITLCLGSLYLVGEILNLN